MHGHARRPQQPRHGSHTGATQARREPRRTQSRLIMITRTQIAHDTQHVNRTNIRANRRSIERMYQCCTCNKHPRGGVSPRHKKQGRWVSGLKAECDFRGYLEKLGHGATGWNGAVFAVLAGGGASWCGIFSCCNRCCTLHIVYNVPWIDVDGGEASLSHINVWPSTHTRSVRILDAVRSAIRPVYPGRGLYGLVPIIFWAGRQFPPGVALASVALGSTPKGCSFASLCIAAIAAVCKTATLIRRWFESTTGHWSNG